MFMNNQFENEEIPTIIEAIEKIEEKGYTTKKVEANASNVAEIRVTPESVVVESGGETEIEVILIGNEDIYKYYIEIDKNYYEIKLEDGRINISKEKTDINNKNETDGKIIVTSDNENIQTTINGMKITIKDIGSEVSAGKLSIKYGEITKEITISIKLPLEKAEEETEYRRCYADTDGDGEVDGIIYADVLHGRKSS